MFLPPDLGRVTGSCSPRFLPCLHPGLQAAPARPRERQAVHRHQRSVLSASNSTLTRGWLRGKAEPTCPPPPPPSPSGPSPGRNRSPSQDSGASWPASRCRHRCSCPRCLRLWRQRLSRRQVLAQAVIRGPWGMVTHLRHG